MKMYVREKINLETSPGHTSVNGKYKEEINN